MHSVNSLAFMIVCLAAPLSLAAAAVPGGAAGKVPLHTMLEVGQADGAGAVRKMLAARQRITTQRWNVILKSNGSNPGSALGDISYDESQVNHTSPKTAQLYVSLSGDFPNDNNEEVGYWFCSSRVVNATPQSLKAGWSAQYAGAVLDVLTIKRLLRSQPLVCKVSSVKQAACSASLIVGSKVKCLTGDSLRTSKCVNTAFGSSTTTTGTTCTADTAGSTVVAVVECGGPGSRWEMSAEQMTLVKTAVTSTA